MMIPRDDEVRIVDLEEERDRAVLRPDGAAFRAMAFSPDGRWLATSLVDGTVRVYDAANGRERLPRLALRGSGLAPEGSEWINSLAFSPDGSVLAGCWNRIPVAPSPGGLSLWDLDTGRQRWTAEFRAGPSSLAFSPDGQMISTAGSSEPMPRFWDVSTGREASPQPGHTLGITALAAAADGTIFTGSPDGTVRRWDPGTGRELEIVARPGPVSTLAVSADGKRLIVVGSYGTPVLWSVSDHRERNRLYEFPEQGTNQPVACSPDGRTVARGRRIWDAASGRLLKTLRTAGEREGFEPDGPIFYTPDGKRVVTAEPGVVRTWDIETGVEAAPPMRSGRILPASVAVSADARFLATGLPLLQAGRLQLPSEWWPDGWIRVWELATGREIAKLPVQQDSVSGVALSPDGRLLATFRTGGDPVGNPEQPPIQDPTIRVWDVMSGRERRRLVGHRGVVNTAVFTPDGRSLVSAGEDATAIVWDVSDLRASTIGPR
jgi:WD40 repeat protein